MKLPTALLALLAASIWHPAAAHVVRHADIPESYRGNCAPYDASRKYADKSSIVRSAKSYVSPKASCTVESVSETPSARGPTYSARMECSDRTGRSKKKTTSNLIMRSDTEGRILAGASFNNLKPLQRCSTQAPAAAR